MLTSAEYFWGFSNAATKESRSSGIVSFVFADLAVLVLAVAAEKKLLKVLILLAKIHPSFASVAGRRLSKKDEEGSYLG